VQASDGFQSMESPIPSFGLKVSKFKYFAEELQAFCALIFGDDPIQERPLNNFL